MTITTQDLTCEEIHTGFDALIKRIAELTAERDLAMQMASQATKDQERERREHKAELKLLDGLISSVRIDRDDKHDQIRRLNARVRELALTNEDLQRQLDAAQQEPEVPAPRRRFLKHAGNRKDRP